MIHKPYIYLFIRVSDNSPIYVGQHQGSDPDYMTGSTILNKQYQKWGKKKFWETYRREIIKYTKIHLLNIVETLYIAHYSTYIGNNSEGYNLTQIGGTSRGYSHTEETKDLISRANIGRVYTEERNQKISKSLTGVKREPLSLEHCSSLKISWKDRQSEICPHCGFEGQTNMKRWHFDNCPEFTGKPREKKTEESNRKRRETYMSKPLVKCPHCKYESRNAGVLNRLHFNNCKIVPI